MNRQFLFKSLISIFATMALWASCYQRNTSPVAPPEGFDWQGHRGCRGLRPENSIPAFLHALEIPELTTLELDLAVSKDGQLVVSHEPWFEANICLLPSGDTIKPNESEKYLILNYTAAEIRGFDCGSKGNNRFPEQEKMRVYKPTLGELVDTLRKSRPERVANILWNMEIKTDPEWDGIRTPPVDSFAALVVKQLRMLGLDKNTMVQSFDTRALEAVHRMAPEIPLVYLVENVWGFETNIDKLTFKPNVYSPYHELVTPKLIKKCRERGIKVVPWTVNDLATMRSLIHLGVDGIITDYPNLISQVKG
ncbi:MAG: glycerophosphodiester phosphodiesterase [Bacteroidetes bacterium]|nr:glycerophosphodiester phosphodiesterase [Bacteroidota bacterium]